MLKLLSTFLASLATANETCLTGIDIVQLQDMTSSFDDKWETMASQVGQVINYMNNIDEDTFFGFATFGDKPVWDLGYSTDYCLKVDLSLTIADPVELEAVFLNYASTAAGGGADWEEAVYEGTLRALVAPQIGWRDNRIGDSSRFGRVLVVVTDAMSHLMGDVAKSASALSLPAFNVSPDDLRRDGPNYGCDKFEYPSLKELADVIVETNATVFFLTSPAGFYDEFGVFQPYYQIAINGERYQGFDGIKLWYEDQLRLYGISQIIVKMLDTEMSAYASTFVEGIEQYLSMVCPTEPPTESTQATEATSTFRSSISTLSTSLENSQLSLPQTEPESSTFSQVGECTNNCRCSRCCCCH